MFFALHVKALHIKTITQEAIHHAAFFFIGSPLFTKWAKRAILNANSLCGVGGSCIFALVGADARAFSYAVATVKRLTVCGRQKAVYSSACVALNAETSKRLLVTGRQRAV